MLTADELRKKMEEEKKNLGDENEESLLEKREKAMRSYLDDVAPVSDYINREFAKIDAKTLTKKDGNNNGR